MVFQLPHHFEALRCMAIERLWDGQQGREPLHDLMGDIMRYCRKPELSLDCPREEILTKLSSSVDFMFTDNDTVYGVCKVGSEIMLCRISAFSTTRVSGLCTGVTERKAWACYFDPNNRKLYVLCENGGALFQHDMDGGKTDGPLMIDQFPPSEAKLVGMIALGDSLYVAMHRSDYYGSTTGIRVYSVQFVPNSEVRPVYNIPKQNNDGAFSFIGFSRVPDSREAVDIRYNSNSKWHSARISVIRASEPRLFSTRIDEAVEAQGIQGYLVTRTAGVNHFLVDEGDHYVLRRRRGLRKAATIRGTIREKSLPHFSPIIFDRWTFSYIGEGITGDKCLIRCHPYLM
ncbi:hypothetical protein FOZ63_003725 [Perkinsus olseni]|uniref:Uncharacterized protein n=1 Tax=Perkinsus olseni TaxID=32597 RepID=A0A7J6PG60_PEROL|nr:hypothetical protein FOZ63_003725 [Perkinsus olseni]KAF4722163.1 hypothetical protein FOZ62_007607 [Perkinsus olseni]